MKLSIVTAVLDSHEIVRRQLIHYRNMLLPYSDVEVILVDDGSDTPIRNVLNDLRPFIANDSYIRIIETNDKREWTQPKARNIGIKHAKGEYLMLADLDFIITEDVIKLLRNTKHELIRFKREAGVLNEEGRFTQDWDVLKTYGLLPKYKETLKLPPHSNTFAIKKDLYLRLGGVSERYCGTGKYPNREEVPFKNRLKPLLASGEVDYIGDDNRPTVYMFPNGRYCGGKDYNPFGLFHELSREGKRELHKTNRGDRPSDRTFDNNPG